MPLVTEQTIDILKRWELYMGVAYKDKGAKSPWSFGYGHSVLRPFVLNGVTYDKVVEGMTISEPDALQLLRDDAEFVGAYLLKKCLPEVAETLKDNQYGAMIIDAYNIGLGGFTRTDCFKMINSPEIKNHMVKAAILMSDHYVTATEDGVRLVYDGLRARRIVEASYFLHGGWDN